ncbi:MAG: 23S rRNA (guanosine(2251)-2'-O)-methyltransferase RlmB [Hyphomicrobiales bacterium]|nr:MAG: 23S rRNA (guanosine(2251)-2'-O)-methyltransferase RlmB [Hyphomicrobiales bacterium]
MRDKEHGRKHRHGGGGQQRFQKFRPGKRGGEQRRFEKDTSDPEHVVLYGIHAVEAALRNPARRVDKLLLTDNAQRRLHDVLQERGVTGEAALPKDLDRRLGPDTVHQGAMLETAPLEEPDLEALAELADQRPLLVLDQVTDPHNVGAILRSAAVFGAAGLVMTRRHSPPLDGTLAKSASGALEHVPVALVGNLARTIEELKDLGFLVVGLDGEGEGTIEAIDWSRRIALVLGAEGKGLRQLTRESCDQLCRITADGPLASLNVSNAAAVSLHFASFKRRQS